MILIPSAMWIDLTFTYMKTGNIIDWYYVISTLYCVAIFSIILLLFTVDTYVNNSSWLYMASVFGVSIFTFHTMFLDGLIWTVFFNRN